MRPPLSCALLFLSTFLVHSRGVRRVLRTYYVFSLSLQSLSGGKGVSRGRLQGAEHPRAPRKSWTNAVKQKRAPVRLDFATGMVGTKLLPPLLMLIFCVALLKHAR